MRSTKLKGYILSHLSWIILSVSIAQVKQQAYREFIIEPNLGEDYQIFKAGEQKVVAVLDSYAFTSDKKKKIILTLMGENLEIIWKKEFLIPKKQHIMEYAYDNGYIYLLTSTSNHQYHFLKINTEDATETVISYPNEQKFYLNQFIVSDSIFLLGGIVNNYPAVYQFNYMSGEVIILPSIHQIRTEIEAMYIDALNKEIVIILSKNYGSKDRGVYINQYDYRGKMKHNTVISDRQDYKLLNFQIASLADKKLFILGNYGLKESTKTQGVYTIKLSGKSIEHVRFYDFAYFKNFFKYIPKKQRKRLRFRIEKRHNANKPYYLKYSIFPHRLALFEKRIVFSGEIYKPVVEDENRFTRINRRSNLYPYSFNMYQRINIASSAYQNSFSNSSFTPSALNSQFPKTYTNPSKYVYSHTFACGFNMNGQLIWDNTYVFPPKTSERLPIELSKVAVKNNDTVIFVHAQEEFLYSKWNKESIYTDTCRIDTLALPHTGDELITFYNGGIIHWYATHFLHSGIRKIRNRIDSSQRRKVFFVTQFSFTSLSNREEKKQMRGNKHQ